MTPHEVAVAVEACAFAVVNLAPPYAINRHGVVMGDIAWDDCACGQLVVSESRRYPSGDFPLEEVNHTAECYEPWIVVSYTLSLTRCVSMPDENGVPPDILTLTAEASRNSSDMTAVRRALICCFAGWYDANQVQAWELGSQEVTGPLGGCGGFDMTFMVGWTNDCGC